MEYTTAFLNYLGSEKKYAQHTLTSYATDLKQFQSFLSETYDTEDLASANYAMIRQWIVSFVDQGFTSKTINRKLSSLKTFFKFLQKIKAIDKNPMINHKTLKNAILEQDPFSVSELKAVFDYFEDGTFEGLRDHLIIELLYTTGMRRQELIDLKLSSLDSGQRQLKIVGKRNKERIVPLLGSTLELIEQYLESRKIINPETDKLFVTKKGEPIYPNLVYRTVNTYFKNVSTKHKQSPHLLRHAFASHLLEKGADMIAIKDLLGHSSLASTEVYTHSNFKELSKTHEATHPRSLRLKE